jgi:hypothetical protein
VNADFRDISLLEKMLPRRTKLELRRIMVGKIVILGVFVADTTYRANRAPRIGETMIRLSSSFVRRGNIFSRSEISLKSAFTGL